MKKEYIAAPDGRWLGGFDSEYVVPADSTRFSLGYPVGWTNCSWYEHTGCNQRYHGCTCSDCAGTYVAFLHDQRQPGDTIDPCWTISAVDGWAVAIAPKICQDGCSNCLGAAFCFGPAGASDTVRCGAGCGGQETAAGWPLVEFGGANPSTSISVVTDTTGPPDEDGPPYLVNMKAMRIDFSGAGSEGATFVGQDGGHDISRPPFTNSSTPPSGDFLNNTRSSTGIDLNPGDCVHFWCWVKAVPDRYGYTCVGYDFRAFLNFGVSVKQEFNHVTLNGAWQFLAGDITIDYPGEPLVNMLLHLLTTNSNTTDERDLCHGDDPAHPGRTVQNPRGRVHVKDVHLVPCKPPPVHVWRWH